MNKCRIYEIRSRKDKRGFALISDALPFGRLWYGGPNAISNVIGYDAALQPITSRRDSRL
jgi:hypothetical protein